MSFRTQSHNFGYATNSYLARPVTKSFYRTRAARELAGERISRALVGYRRRAQYRRSALGLSMAMRRRGFPRDLTRFTASFIKPRKRYVKRVR